jgi:hypothetical protein
MSPRIPPTAPDAGSDPKPGKRPAWREPMVWLVIAIPVAAIAATIAMLVVASRSSGNNDSVDDAVRRTAQIQIADIGPDAMARQMRLSAIVRADIRGTGAVEVIPVQGGFDRSATLALTLQHPSQAGLDRSFALGPTATGWRAEGALDLSHDWNIQVTPPDRRWRLQGRWTARQRAAYLQPAIARE